MKNVQIRFDEDLLRAIDRLAASYQISSSAMVREALKNWSRQRKIQEFEEAWICKLKENPDNVTDSETWLHSEK